MTHHPTTDTPRIYVTCLASYNAGILHGAWIDLDQSLDDLQEAVSAMLEASPVPDAEEWAIHDYEGFGELCLSEHESLDHVHALACFMREHGEIGAALLAHFGGDLDDAHNALDNYSGCYRDLAEYAEQLTEDTTEIPTSLKGYIDYEAMARDLIYGGDVFTIETAHDETHVFWAH